MADIIIEGITATVIGMGMVFGVLSILCVILSFFKYLTPQEKPKAAPEPEPVGEPEQVYEPEEVQDDSELIAVISAAIAMCLGESSPFEIKSVKPVHAAQGGTYGGWKAAAIRESHRGLY